MRRKFNGTNHGTSAGGCGDCWVEDWNAEVGKQNSMGRLTRDVRRQERTDMRNRFLSIDMDAKVCVGGKVHAIRSAVSALGEVRQNASRFKHVVYHTTAVSKAERCAGQQ